MLQLSDISKVLRRYRDRYQYLDVFVDDIGELRPETIAGRATVVREEPHPVLAIPVESETLLVELFTEQGIARCRLESLQQQSTGNVIAVGAALGTAIGVASEVKEGGLGGLILGMLVGGIIGAAAAPVERVVAMKFDPATENWRLYDGPLLRWAKRTMHPAT